MLNDLFVLTKIKEGDVKAFEAVFRQYYPSLCLYAAGITGSREVGEEIVEELFYVFWKERERLQLFHSIKSYLYGAVRNQSLQYCEHEEVKKRYREVVLSAPLSESFSDPQEQLECKELQALINQTLAKLPKRRLHIFQLHRMGGKKYAEIASILSLSIKTVEAEMSKALQTLRKEIENYTQTT
ncbi:MULTISPECIES: RNA polymerase sigma-70 factor [Bacteroides]|uniref:RNA polymerase sigma-70 factor n=1 Tax=Bacteroides TaxID=816 RepID=UPI0004BC30F8|nr:RNA polymerase sigma-70 factor [Bacteroides neonati]MCP3894612.1 RNA polymerase sigma-70 factor [Bacteroides sp.]